MIDLSVPIRSSLWSGTGTVTVVPASDFCITMWLPRRRTSTNPFSANSPHTSRPEAIRSLGNRDLNPGHVDFLVKAILNLLRRSRFEEKL